VTNRIFSGALLIAALLAPQTGRADEPAAAPRRLSTRVSAAYTTAYVSRGRVLEDRGGIAQPDLEVGLALHEGTGLLEKLSAFGGLWASLHGDDRFAAPGSSTRAWYEFDSYAGVSAAFAGGLTSTLSYWSIVSPSDAFRNFQYVELKVGYDDGPHWGTSGGFSISPSAKLIVPVHNTAGTGTRKGQYLELGVAPGYTLAAGSAYPVRLSVPVAVGLGFDGFYAKDADGVAPYAPGASESFGFASAGLAASVPLAFASDAGVGKWSLSASATYYRFGDGVKDFNRLAVATTSKDGTVAGSVGLAAAF
jgi:hypothetical protein